MMVNPRHMSSNLSKNNNNNNRRTFDVSQEKKLDFVVIMGIFRKKSRYQKPKAKPRCKR